MRATVDRRVALVTYVVLTTVVIITTALTDVSIEVDAVRDDPYAYARLLVAARTADSTSVESQIEIVRTVGARTQRIVVHRARTPRGSVEWTDESATLRTSSSEWNCFTVEDDWNCVRRIDAKPTLSFGTPTLFVAAAASGDYRFGDLGRRRVADRDAHCYEVVLVGSTPVAGIGTRYEPCFAVGGPLVSSHHERAGSVEEQRTLALAEIDDADLAARFAEASRGIVTLDNAPIR
jgi:hypothetical protein